MTPNHQPNLPIADHRNKPRNTLSMPDLYKIARAFEKLRAEIKAHKYTNETLIKFVAETLQITATRANVNTALEMAGLSLGTPRGGRNEPRLGGDGYGRIKLLEQNITSLNNTVGLLTNKLTELQGRIEDLEQGLGVAKVS